MKYINILFYAPVGMDPLDEEMYGYAYVFESEGGFTVEYFQDRLNLRKEKEKEMFDELFVWSKSWCERCKTQVEAINLALRFWGREKIDKLPEIKSYGSVYQAIKGNPESKEIYYYQTERNKKIWFRVGMDLLFTEEDYNRIVSGNLTQEDVLQAIRSGDAVLTGETYAPNIDYQFEKSEIAVEAEGVKI